MKQVYCKEGTLCSKYPLEKRKIIKKTIKRCIGLFVVITFLSWPAYRAYKEIKIIKENNPFLWESFLSFKKVELINGKMGLVNAPLRWSEIVLVIRMFLFFLLASIFIFIFTLVYEIFYFRFYFYDVTEKELIVRKGVLARREVTIPFSRIQDVYVDQDILDRIFGLYDVHIATAATAVYGSERAHIDGVNFENAQALKNLIIDKIRKDSTKPGV